MISKDKNKEFFKLLEEVTAFSHAYLFDTNSIKDAYPYVLKFVKKIICANHYINDDECGECNICHLIDEGSYSDYYLVNPETININKEEIDKLFHAFTGKSLEENGKRVYVIYGIERMDEYVSNKILKFLEEPLDNIHAILITENKDKLLSTIKSRCQIIKINVENVEISQENLEYARKFFEHILKNGTKTIAYTNELVFEHFEDKVQFKELFGLIERIVLNEIDNRNNGDNNSSFKDISLNSLIKIVQITDKLSRLINNNINLNLLIDRYIIEISKEVRK